MERFTLYTETSDGKTIAIYTGYAIECAQVLADIRAGIVSWLPALGHYFVKEVGYL